MPHLIVAPQLLIVTWFIRLPLRRRLSIFLGYLLIGGLLTLVTAGPKRTLFLVLALSGPFVLYPLAGLYFLLSRRMLALQETGTSKSELASRLGCEEKEVRRLLDPRHPSKLPRIQRALASLGKGLAVTLVNEAA